MAFPVCPTPTQNPADKATFWSINSGQYTYCIDPSLSSYPGASDAINQAVSQMNQAIGQVGPSFTIIPSTSSCNINFKGDPGQVWMGPQYGANNTQQYQDALGFRGPTDITFYFGADQYWNYFDYPGWISVLRKTAIHELAHTFGLRDQYAINPNDQSCGSEVQGESIMNMICAVNDQFGWLPDTITACDLNAMINLYNQVAAGTGGSGGGPGCGYTTIEYDTVEWESNCQAHYHYIDTYYCGAFQYTNQQLEWLDCTG